MRDWPTVTSSSSLAAFLDAVGVLASYAREKALYEADCRLREKAAEIRAALFANESARCLSVTTELARCKMKLSLLKKEVMSDQQPARQLLLPLLEDLEARIAELRSRRVAATASYRI